jgi:hypothetical protein
MLLGAGAVVLETWAKTVLHGRSAPPRVTLH